MSFDYDRRFFSAILDGVIEDGDGDPEAIGLRATDLQLLKAAARGDKQVYEPCLERVLYEPCLERVLAGVLRANGSSTPELDHWLDRERVYSNVKEIFGDTLKEEVPSSQRQQQQYRILQQK